MASSLTTICCNIHKISFSYDLQFVIQPLFWYIMVVTRTFCVNFVIIFVGFYSKFVCMLCAALYLLFSNIYKTFAKPRTQSSAIHATKHFLRNPVDVVYNK